MYKQQKLVNKKITLPWFRKQQADKFLTHAALREVKKMCHARVVVIITDNIDD